MRKQKLEREKHIYWKRCGSGKDSVMETGKNDFGGNKTKAGK